MIFLGMPLFEADIDGSRTTDYGNPFLSVFELTPFATKAYQSAHISHFQRESVWRLG